MQEGIKLQESLRVVRAYASTQPDILLCDKILTVCDHVIVNDNLVNYLLYALKDAYNHVRIANEKYAPTIDGYPSLLHSLQDDLKETIKKAESNA